MKISTNSRYAIRFLVRLAESGGRLTTMSIARTEGISEKMLERIAAKLGREGFVRSIKGIGGGYELARPAGEITVSQVLEAMETPYLPLHCVECYKECRMFSDCSLISLWSRIDGAIRSVTETVTLASLVEERGAKARQSRAPITAPTVR